MHKSFFKLILIIIIISTAYMQSCQDNCGSGSLQDYFDGLAECVCSLDCAGYGEACCDYYDECYQNPTNLEFNDFVGTWNGNITNDQTFLMNNVKSIKFFNFEIFLKSENRLGRKSVLQKIVSFSFKVKFVCL